VTLSVATPLPRKSVTARSHSPTQKSNCALSVAHPFAFATGALADGAGTAAGPHAHMTIASALASARQRPMTLCTQLDRFAFG
jgi:hypothetical protein